MRFIKLTAAICALCTTCLIGLQGCKDSNNTEDDSILGLWQLDSSEGDVYYVNITTELVTFYDYLGDEYDEGPECYEIITYEILDINGDTYTFEDPFDPETTVEVEVIANGNRLSVSQPFGSGTVTLEFSKSNASIDSFTPECEENQLKADTGSFFKKI